MCRQTFAIVIMLLLFSRIASAQIADSIVTVSSVDFEGDTISARYEIVTHFWKGKETFNRDSTLRDQYAARWIEKKNSLECWYYQNYFSSDENDGIGYSLMDTTYNGQFTIIKSYGLRRNKRVDQWKRPRKKDLIHGYTVVKDKYGRDVEITHFDIIGKVTYTLVYTYSK